MVLVSGEREYVVGESQLVRKGLIHRWERVAVQAAECACHYTLE